MTDHVMGPVPTEDPMHRLVAGYRRQLAERTAERDRARATAVALEQQLAKVVAVLGQAHVPVALRVHAVEALLSDVGDLVGIEGMPAIPDDILETLRWVGELIRAENLRRVQRSRTWLTAVEDSTNTDVIDDVKAMLKAPELDAQTPYRRRRREMTDELLSAVLSVHAVDGLGGVMHTWGVSKSTAARWVALAKSRDLS